MADLKYNFVDNNFTTYESVKEPEVKIPVIGDLVDISPWASGIAYSSSGESVPIAKNNISTPKMIDDNNPEQEIIQTSSNNQFTGKNMKGNQKVAYDFFINKGLQPHQAAGIVGNLMLESGDMSLNKTDNIGDRDKGPNGSSYGIAQWRLDRRTALKNFAAKRGKPMSDLITQLEFLWDEMNGSQKKFKVLEGLMNSSTVEEATASFMNTFERPNSNPKINGIDKRIKYAKSLLA